MDVPEGLVVTEIDSKGGNFTFENNRAKIVWVSIPPEPELTIKVKVYPSGSSPPSATISQRLAFLQEGSKKEIEAPTVIITILGAENIMGTHKKAPLDPKEAPVVAAKEPAKTESKPLTTSEPEKPIARTEAPKVAEPVKTELVKVEPVAKTETPKAEHVKTEAPKPAEPAKAEPVKAAPVAKTEAPKPVETPKVEPVKAAPVVKTEAVAVTTDLVYKVQLAASPSESVKDKFVSLGGGLTTSKEDGAYKVLYGTYNTKEDALKAREELIAKGFTGFLVKYQNGIRVK